MEIGVMMHLNGDKSIHDKFYDVHQMGFNNCQLCSWDSSLRTDACASELIRRSHEYDVAITAFWCGWDGPKVWDLVQGPTTIGLVPPEYRDSRISQLKSGSDFAGKLGITDVVTHVGFIPEDPMDSNFEALCQSIYDLAMYLKTNNQNLLFETGQETPETLLRCIKTVGLDNLFVNLDTANLILYGKAYPTHALDIIGKYVKNIHAKDGLFPEDEYHLGKEVPIGSGEVDFAKLIDKLKKLDYNGPITIEREINGQQQIDDIINAKKFLSKLIVNSGETE